MRIPDFFIIGAPKCGTTSLYTYLSEHPRVFMPELKEPHYFSRDLPGLTQIGKHEDYLGLFASAASGALLGEASVWYLFSEAAVPAIAAANPAAKLIVLLRNPIDAAYSLHTHFLRTLRENQEEFATAWALQDERRRGRELPSYCPEPQCLQYREVCSFGFQVQRLCQRFPAQQVRVLIHEEFLSTCSAVTAS